MKRSNCFLLHRKGTEYRINHQKGAHRNPNSTISCSSLAERPTPASNGVRTRYRAPCASQLTRDAAFRKPRRIKHNRNQTTARHQNKILQLTCLSAHFVHTSARRLQHTSRCYRYFNPGASRSALFAAR